MHGLEDPHKGNSVGKTLSIPFILLHRLFIKSYRDIVAYWIRFAMYIGLAIMMGTVWLRLHTDQRDIQAYINALVSELYRLRTRA